MGGGGRREGDTRGGGGCEGGRGGSGPGVSALASAGAFSGPARQQSATVERSGGGRFQALHDSGAYGRAPQLAGGDSGERPIGTARPRTDPDHHRQAWGGAEAGDRKLFGYGGVRPRGGGPGERVLSLST